MKHYILKIKDYEPLTFASTEVGVTPINDLKANGLFKYEARIFQNMERQGHTYFVENDDFIFEIKEAN